MRPGKRFALPVFALVLTILVAVPYGAASPPPEDTPDRPHSDNLRLIGASLRAGAVTGPPPVGPGTVPWDTRNTDLAFWGKTAIQGRYDGFRIVDFTNKKKPVEIARFECVSPQGDIGVYGDLVFRSVDSPQQTDGCTTTSQSGSPTDCAPVSTPCTGFEGIQIFDISDLGNIELIASVALDCGSHTHTVVPDEENDRVLIYNSVSGNMLQANPGKYGNRCPGPPFNREDIVEVPLDDPASADLLGSFDLGDHEGDPVEICHDFGVILGKVNRGACAGHGISVFDLTDPANPEHLYTTTAPTVDRFHSAAFTWDGKIIVSGWEPGGGTAPRCQATGTVFRPPPLDDGGVQTEEMRTAWFHDAETGEIIGKYVLPRLQSQYENCTIHNYNIVPSKQRYLLVHGSYQSGTALVDFTNPTNAYEIAWMDPLPLDPPSPTNPEGGRTAFRGGDWASYWYDGDIFESDTRRGLYIWDVRAWETKRPMAKMDYLNPQTSHFSIDSRGRVQN